MALLMGGRGAGRDFQGIGPLERLSLYRELAEGYERLGKTAPAFDPEPDYHEIEFHHDEREHFQQRYVAKSLATSAAGLAGLEGGLAREGCAMLQKLSPRRAAGDRLRGATRRGTRPDARGAAGDQARAGGPRGSGRSLWASCVSSQSNRGRAPTQGDC